MIKEIKNFVIKNRTEVIILSLILLLALGLRLYRISEYMTFLGDEGRDVRIVRDLITKGNLVFIGPQTSIGNMYLGPLYYYMMAPALALSALNPVGPAIMIALLGTFTIWFTWLVARNWFGARTALIASILFALSPVAIIYSRSSWNPNPMPFFALLSIWGIYQVWHNKKYFWLPYVGISFAAALQMHYLGLLLTPALFAFWIFTFRAISGKDEKRIYWHKTLWATIWFILIMSPLVFFDIKHHGQNINAFIKFFSNRQETVNLNPARSDRFVPAIESIVSELLLGSQMMYSGIMAIIIGILTFFSFFGKFKVTLKDLKTPKNPGLILLLSWIGLGVLGLGVYKQHIYAHYFGFLFPAVFILVGFLLDFLWQKQLIWKIISVLFLIFLISQSVLNSPLRFAPNRQLQRTQMAVDLIIQQSEGKPFNFGLIAKQNYDESYRYFFENKKANMVRGEDKITDQLFAICEDGDSCQPEGNPQYQIAIFGPSHVVGHWQIDYLKIYRLVHTK